MSNNNTSAIGLFAGAGGLDLGFRQAGVKTVAAFDLSEAAVKSYNFNAKRKISSVLNLATRKPPEIIAVAESRCDKHTTKPKLVLGGPPCQGFSKGNASADPNDPRNKLAYRYIDALIGIDQWSNIDAFVFENVPCLRSPRHLPRFRRILRKLEKAGYVVFEDEINSANFGVPQTRRRLFLVGFNKRLKITEFDFPNPMKKYLDKPLTVRDAIAHLPKAAFRSNGMSAKDIPYHPNHWTSQPVSNKFATQNFNSGRSFRRLEWDKPSPTVAYGNREIHIHPNGKRRLTILEAMLLQGFPETYELRGNFSQQVAQVSNAVPPPVAKSIAKAVLSKLDS